MKPNLEQAVSALKSGQRTRARQLLVEIVKDQPKNAQAWYVLSFVVDNQNQQIYCLQRVLKFAPEHQAARTKLEKLISQSSSQYNSTEYHSPKDTQVEQTDTSPVVENDKNFNVSTRPSLSSIFQQWFRVLSYREQKVIEYLYLDVNEFSTSAVGRIIGEDLQKVLEIKRKSLDVPGVLGTEKCYIRKAGMKYHVDLHAIVKGGISVKEGHDIAHRLKDYLHEGVPGLGHILIHIEPG